MLHFLEWNKMTKPADTEPRQPLSELNYQHGNYKYVLNYLDLTTVITRKLWNRKSTFKLK